VSNDVVEHMQLADKSDDDDILHVEKLQTSWVTILTKQANKSLQCVLSEKELFRKM